MYDIYSKYNQIRGTLVSKTACPSVCQSMWALCFIMNVTNIYRKLGKHVSYTDSYSDKTIYNLELQRKNCTQPYLSQILQFTPSTTVSSINHILIYHGFMIYKNITDMTWEFYPFRACSPKANDIRYLHNSVHIVCNSYYHLLINTSATPDVYKGKCIQQ